MVFSLRILATGATLIATIFVILFLYLVTKWSIKRSKEISKRFEYETKNLQTSEKRIKEIENMLISLRNRYNQALHKKDKVTTDLLSKEIQKLERERKRLYKKIQKF